MMLIPGEPWEICSFSCDGSELLLLIFISWSLSIVCVTREIHQEGSSIQRINHPPILLRACSVDGESSECFFNRIFCVIACDFTVDDKIVPIHGVLDSFHHFRYSPVQKWHSLLKHFWSWISCSACGMHFLLCIGAFEMSVRINPFCTR